MRREDIGTGTAWREQAAAAALPILADGGSCLAGPDGEWIIPPAPAGETLLTAEIDHHRVLEERQNLDPSGHYSRPDVTRLLVDRRRQSIVSFDSE